ncbi:RecX family transcriptional regulator [Candidatus Daviesbacteria bacterium]|nr:RecX family transcriptional regulator [Candidatus Daviesbacteria bacterium]
MKITQVEPQKTLRFRSGQAPKRFNIFLDGQFAFGADEDLVVEYRLLPGKQLDNSELERLIFEAEVGKLMERMYGLFNIRQRSEKEIRNYLRNLSFKRKIRTRFASRSENIIALARGTLPFATQNVKEFAKAWVEARRKSKKKGKIALKSELYQKGISREIIEGALSVKGEGESEEELAKQAIEKKLKKWTSLPYLEKKKKMYEFLMRRGFEYSVVKNVVDNYLKKE